MALACRPQKKYLCAQPRQSHTKIAKFSKKKAPHYSDQVVLFNVLFRLLNKCGEWFFMLSTV